MAGQQSKTARASMRAAASSGNAAITILGDIRYLVPLNRGRNAYVRNIVAGRTPNLRTDSEQFVEEIRQLAAAGHGAKLRVELEQFAVDYPGDGWDVTLKRLEEAGVFAG